MMVIEEMVMVAHQIVQKLPAIHAQLLAAPCTTVCGDGVILGGEECDDGNTASGDGCDSTCKV
jgi:cysteine-rich repeat protein